MIDKELMLLVVANGFLSEAMSIQSYEDNFIKDNDSKETITLKKILIDVAKKSVLFKKKVNKTIKKADDLFNTISDNVKKELKHPKPMNRFKKMPRLNEDGDLEVNGIMFAISLMMLHKEMPHKKLYLQYKLIEEVYRELIKDRSKRYMNAIILARKYYEEIQK